MDVARRIPERLRNVDLTVYEKNEGVGGVWYELHVNSFTSTSCADDLFRWLNKYPGMFEEEHLINLLD